MAGRRLSPEEQMLWGKVVRTVRPMPGRKISVAPDIPTGDAGRMKRLPITSAVTVSAKPPSKAARHPVDVLDTSWEKRIARGALIPDRSIDLHGHTLDSAHHHLDMALSAAIRSGARVLLVVTGKPRPASHAHGEKPRGAIRAEIGHWLAASPYADSIASIRPAHPRHGGAGAIYVILRRNK